MTDITVIILVGREERHIRRCLERLAPLALRQIVVVESQKGDGTHEIAIETAKCLNWRMRECLNVGIEECLNEKGVGGRCWCTAGGLPSSNQTFKHSNIQTFLTTVYHDWPRNQAMQFDWTLDNLPIDGEWDFVKLGFLDGAAGLSWNYWQGLWYRRKVESEMREIKKGRA